MTLFYKIKIKLFNSNLLKKIFLLFFTLFSYILWLEVDIIIILHIKQLFSIVLLLICIIWLSTFVSSHAPMICFFCFDLDLQLGSIMYYYYCTRTRYVPTRKRRLNTTHYKRKMVFLHVIIANGFVGWTLYFTNVWQKSGTIFTTGGNFFSWNWIIPIFRIFF